MDNPPPYSENVPAHYVRATNTPGDSTNINPSILTYAMEQSRPIHFNQVPQQKQFGQPLEENRPAIGFQPAVPIGQNITGQPPHPAQAGGAQPDILFYIPPYSYEPPYRNTSDTNALAPPSPNEYNQSDKFEQFNFDDASIRRAFIKKVYSIVMVQLLVTMVFIAIFLYGDSARLFVVENPALLYVAFVLYFVTVFSMSCCEAPRRSYPYNFIFLGVFTLSLSFLMGIVASTYSASEVLLAIGVTAAICLALTLFAFQTKYDFTGAGLYLFCIFIPLFIFGLYAMVSHNPTMRLLYAALGVVLFSVYLVYDTQLMIGRKHKYSISPEDYVFAALSIYLDVMIIFMKILQLMKR